MSDRPTVAQVAALAGVAPSTVSKALNDTGQLSPATRRRVREAAEAAGLLPGRSARDVAPGRTYTVALLTTDSIGRFSLPILVGAENALAAGRLMVLLGDSRDDAARERHLLEVLAHRRVEGVIVTGRRTEPRAHLEVRMPVVYAFAPSEHMDDASVVPDDEAGAVLAVEHLLSLGRSRFAIVSGPNAHRSARVRADAAARRIAEASAAQQVPPMFGAWSEAWGRAAAEALLAREPRIEAIVCGSDQIARGVATRLRDRGARVPADVAVTGFDDWDVMVEASRPPLTSVDLRLGEIGRRSAARLLDAIDGRPHRGLERVPPRLVARASTLGSE